MSTTRSTRSAMIALAAFVLVTLACVTGSPSDAVKRQMMASAEACPPTADYRVLTDAEIEIADELAATISYNDRRVTVKSHLGSWVSDPLPDGPVDFELILQLNDGRYKMRVDGMICQDGKMWIMPPDITPVPDATSEALENAIARPAPTYEFGNVCTLSYVTCPMPTP